MTDLGISGIGDATLIASGGSALVYRARTDEGLDVAVKVLRGMRGAEVMRRFDREQQAAERLHDHPHIIDVHRSGVSTGGEPYLIMPLMRHGSLADELDDGVFAVDRAVADVLAAAEAIDFAHRRGVLHRDLKPGNLLRTDDGSIVVTDFGIARVTDAGITSATIGAATPLYAAPELLSENEASVQSDIYALGAVLYALLAGAPAFSDAPNIWATIAKIRTENPPAIALVPAPVMRVIEQAMAKEPSGRPPTAHQFHLNLLAARDADESWQPPSPAEVTMPAPPPGPASVPIVVIDDTDGSALDPATTIVDTEQTWEAPERPPGAPRFEPAPRFDTPTPVDPSADDRPAAPEAPPAPRSSRAGAKLAASIAALVLIGGLTWVGVSRALGDDGTPDGDIAAPVDTSIPSPVSDDRDDADPAVDEPQPPTTDDGELTDADAPTPEPTVTDRLVSFNGAYFSAYFPEGWSVTRRDIDVGYGFRSEFVNAPDMYLNVDTTPAELRQGPTTVAESAREIASTIASASPVTTETVDGLELHSFTFRNNRGVESIDIFFEVDGDGYAIVAGSNEQPDEVFAIARQVALTIRSAP